MNMFGRRKPVDNILEVYNQTEPEDRIVDLDDDFLRVIHATDDNGVPIVHIYQDEQLLLIMSSVHLDDAIELLTNVKRHLRGREKAWYIEQQS